MNADDLELIREYAIRQSERAFETLVGRYVNLVYSAARRQVKDIHLAEEITQTVFIILARKAKSLGPGTILSSWLYRTTQYVAADALRTLRRRQKREQEAYMQSTLQGAEPETESVWEEISPLLDEGIAHLRPSDRDALILRYFENKSLEEVGVALRMRERAAQKRVMRSLQKLRSFFLKRGVSASTLAIADALSSGAVQAAPSGLATSAVAVSKATTLSASTAGLLGAGLKCLAWADAQAKLAVAAGIAAVLICAISGSVHFLGSSASLKSAFSSFGPDKGYDRRFAWPLNGGANQLDGKPVEYRGQAEWFVPSISGRLNAIEIALGGPGSDRLNLFVAEDHYGFPGEKLEHFANVPIQERSSQTNEPMVLRSVARPGLKAGRKYWLCAEPADTTTASVWYASELPLTNGFAYDMVPGGWAIVDRRLMAQGLPGISAVRSGVRNAAFRVTVK